MLVKVELQGKHAKKPGRQAYMGTATSLHEDDALLLAALLNRARDGAITYDDRVALAELLTLDPETMAPLPEEPAK